MSREAQLRAFMQADAAIWKRRTDFIERASGGELDKIGLAKQRAEAARMVRQKAARAANATKDRRKPRKVHGTMNVTDNRDKLNAPSVKCAWCSKSFSAVTRGNRPSYAHYCSRNCSHSAWRARRIVANG